MDILKILQSIEEFIYELALWVVFIPRTFVKVVFRPRWCHSYVVAEFNKDPKERFDAQMSPIFFWVVVGIIPHLFVVEYLGSVKASTVAQGVEWSQFFGFPWPTRLLVIAIVALGGPLGFSLQILKEKHLAISRASLRRTFYTQCLCFAPAFFFLLPAVAVALRFNQISSEGAASVFAFSVVVFMCWLFYAQVCIIQAELDIGWSSAAGSCLFYSIRSFLLTVFLEYLVIGLAIGLKWNP